MGKPYSLDLRERVVKAIESGETRVSVSQRYDISRRTVGRYIRLRHAKGTLEPKQLGGYKGYALAGHEALISGWIAACPDMTLKEIGNRLRDEELEVCQTAIFSFLRHLDLTYKKNAARSGAGARRRGRGPQTVDRAPAGIRSRNTGVY